MVPKSPDEYKGSSGREDILRRSPSLERPSSSEARSRDEQEERRLLDEVSAVAAQIRRAVAAENAAAARLEEEAAARAETERGVLRSDYERSKAIAGTESAQALTEHRLKATEAARQMASGPALAPYGDETWLTSSPEPTDWPEAVRLGSLALPDARLSNQAVEVPLVVRILNQSNLIIEGDESALDDVAAHFLIVLHRLLASVAPGQLEISWYDPRLRSNLAPLGSLRESDILRPVMTTEAEFEEYIFQLTRTVARVSEAMGGRYRTLGAYHSASGQALEPYRLLVVNDYPSGLSEKAFDALHLLAERGPMAGVNLLVHRNPSLPGPRDRNADDILSHGFVISRTHPRAPGFQTLRYSPDASPPLEMTSSLTMRLNATASTSAAPSVPFEKFLPPPDGRWRKSSAERIDVAIGQIGTAEARFTLGDRTEQLHNVLIGGAVGQGKSNLLLVLIHSIAAQYSPDEVEMYLLDFKEGLEFSVLCPTPDRPYGLPHVRVFGLESDREFGRAVLRDLVAEFDRRAAAFKAAGDVRDIETFRREQPDTRMPRVLVVVDEFQVLFDKDDPVTTETVGLLDTLARKGRAYGFHLVLASQTLSGIQALIAKEDSIFAQFPIRLALKTNRNESQVLLERQNFAASELRYRGEVVFNLNYGATSDNRKAVVAYADEDLLDNLRRDLWNMAAPPVKLPHVFLGGSLATQGGVSGGFVEQLSDSRQPTMFLGLPVSMERAPLASTLVDEPGRHLAIIGSGGPGAIEVVGSIHAAFISLAISAPPGSRFLILDLLGEEARRTANLGGLAELARGHRVDYFERQQVSDAFGQIEQWLNLAETELGPRLFLFAAGMHRALSISRPDPLAEFQAVDVLRRLVREGPISGAHMIGWWNSYRSYEEQIESDFEMGGLLQSFLFLRASREEIANVAGPFVEWSPAPNRGLYLDRSDPDAQRSIVPFAPLSEPSDVMGGAR